MNIALTLEASLPLSDLVITTLQSLRTGEASTIVGVSNARASAKRLADMGFVSGARIELVRRGNPCLVRIGGTFVGLGRDNQSCILVAGRSPADSNAVGGTVSNDSCPSHSP